MEKNYYELREVIMGLRDEYLKARRQLDELKQYVNVFSIYVNGIHFELFKDENKKAELVACYEQKNKLLNFWFNHKYKGYDAVFLKRDESDNYYIPAFYTALITNQEKFKEIKEQIRNSDFVDNLWPTYYDCLTTEDKRIIKNENAMFYGVMDSGVKLSYCDTTLKYDSLNDKFILEMYSKNKNKTSDAEFIKKLLGIKIPNDLLSQYHKDTIDNNPSRKKLITFSEEHPIKKKAQYSIEDDGQKLVLTRK